MATLGAASVGEGDAALPGLRPPSREIVVPDLDSMVRWHDHAYPHPLARWHTHPEVEIHLIRSGTGLAFVGDHVGAFAPGHLTLIGSHLPHNWISDLAPGESIPGRDVVLQVHPDSLRELARLAPDALEAVRLVDSAARGLEYFGGTAAAGARALERIGASTGVERLHHLFGLFAVLSRCPPHERRELSGVGAAAATDPAVQARVNTALDFITEHLTEEIRLPEVAALVDMSPSAFSRFFTRAAGRGFAEMVRRLRIIRACHLLATTSAPVSEICYEVGFGNLSNFNRQFRSETGTTPRRYRATATAGQRSFA